MLRCLCSDAYAQVPVASRLSSGIHRRRVPGFVALTGVAEHTSRASGALAGTLASAAAKAVLLDRAARSLMNESVASAANFSASAVAAS